MSTHQTYFNELADHLKTLLEGEEVFTATFSAEDSDFVRFNKSEVRQAGSVCQRGLSVDLIAGSKHAEGSLSLAGELEQDRPRLTRLLADLRATQAVDLGAVSAAAIARGAQGAEIGRAVQRARDDLRVRRRRWGRR